jgi:23S rRNA (cytosine1962-C5)-methyltransferase
VEDSGAAEGANSRTFVEACPVTGRTHQIRVHAAEHGFPILGDVLYGGTPARRVFLHAAELVLQHPATKKAMTFSAPATFDEDACAVLRRAVIEQARTNANRLIHGASDGWPGWYVDRFGNFLLSQSAQALNEAQQHRLVEMLGAGAHGATKDADGIRGAYHKLLSRHIRRSASDDTSPRLVLGESAAERFNVLENGLRFESSFCEGYSVGLFLDQRENRRRFLVNHVAANFPLFPEPGTGCEVLNTFAYTCGFSVCAAKGGTRTTSLDLSRKHLEWGKRNFALNGLDPTVHDFIYGDAFDWLGRLRKRARTFDGIVLDPPTFSQSKESGTFRADRDYAKLVTEALPLLKPQGVLLASTNAASLSPEEFLESIEAAIRSARRKILQRHYVPQPPDFPISRAEPAYLKTIWLRIA